MLHTGAVEALAEKLPTERQKKQHELFLYVECGEDSGAFQTYDCGLSSRWRNTIGRSLHETFDDRVA